MNPPSLVFWPDIGLLVNRLTISFSPVFISALGKNLFLRASGFIIQYSYQKLTIRNIIATCKELFQKVEGQGIS